MGRDQPTDGFGSGKAVSIRAPAWGAIFYLPNIALAHQRFNSRARMGRDAAPALRVGLLSSFNSRARMGRDVPFFVEYGGEKFQFARPHGARFLSLPLLKRPTCFNSRARMGRDLLSKKKHERTMGFNSRARMGRDN